MRLLTALAAWTAASVVLALVVGRSARAAHGDIAAEAQEFLHAQARPRHRAGSARAPLLAGLVALLVGGLAALGVGHLPRTVVTTRDDGRLHLAAAPAAPPSSAPAPPPAPTSRGRAGPGAVATSTPWPAEASEETTAIVVASGAPWVTVHEPFPGTSASQPEVRREPASGDDHEDEALRQPAKSGASGTGDSQTRSGTTTSSSSSTSSTSSSTTSTTTPTSTTSTSSSTTSTTSRHGSSRGGTTSTTAQPTG